MIGRSFCALLLACTLHLVDTPRGLVTCYVCCAGGYCYTSCH